MTREQGPKFSEKHGSDAQVDPTAKKIIEKNAKNGEVTCAAAFRIADELKISPADVGIAIDLLDFKLIKCQLGLFGYVPDKKAVKAKPSGNQQMDDAIRAALVEAKLTCYDAWEIARRFAVSKMAVSAACEDLNIKIKPCQLGAF